jgi:hypothetical protein
VNVTIAFDQGSALRALSRADKSIAKAASSAINKTLVSTQSNVRRAVARNLGARVKDVRFRITLPRRYKATARKLKGDVAVWAMPIKAHKLGQPKNAKGGATVRGAAGGRRKFPGAFAASPRGKPVVFRRQGQRRLPLEVVKVPLQPMAGRIAVATFNRIAGERLSKTFVAELRWRQRGRR